MKLTHHYLWLAIGWVLIGFVIYATLAVTPPDIDIGFVIWDKLAHFLSYALLMSWFVQIYHTATAHLRLLILLIVLGVILEILQGLGGVRILEFADMIANSLGVLLGWLLGRTRFSKLLLRLEERVFSKTF